MRKILLIKVMHILMAVFFIAVVGMSVSACSDDDEPRDHDSCLYGEWIENDGKIYVHGWMEFYSDGSGLSGSWESDIDWVNEEDEFNWYTVDDEYHYIDGHKYNYYCDGSRLTIYNYRGKDRSYREK